MVRVLFSAKAEMLDVQTKARSSKFAMAEQRRLELLEVEQQEIDKAKQRLVRSLYWLLFSHWTGCALVNVCVTRCSLLFGLIARGGGFDALWSLDSVFRGCDFL